MGYGKCPLWAQGRHSGMVAADESSELLGHSVNQFLLVTLVFPELCKHVILAASIFHPKQRRERGQGVSDGTTQRTSKKQDK